MTKTIEPTEAQLEFGRVFPEVVLASGSPNRKALLEKGGCIVHRYVPDTEETRDETRPEETVREIAEGKMKAYLSSPAFRPDLPGITADTLVLFEGKLLGKPRDNAEAAEFLRFLSGGFQTVLSGCVLYRPDRKDTVSFTTSSRVLFRNLSEEEIDDYVSTGECIGAAGAYRLQKTGWKLVERIEGSWSNVVGLPLEDLIAHR